jgi:peptidoglycan DL-endopeptidase LytE
MRKQILTLATATGILFSGIQGTASASENTYTVKPGDTLWEISHSNQLSIRQIMEWNHLTSANINIGQTLKLSQSNDLNSTTYTVKSGDTLWKIANSIGMTVSELKSMNGLSNDSIRIGQMLVIKSNANHFEPSSTSKNTYMVKSGDTLWSIATQHQLSISQLKTYNQLSSDIIYVNQVLKLTSNGTETLPPLETSVSKIDMLINEAKKYLGVPYKWGGSTPEGFDCSGYLNYVYSHAGVSIPRTVATIWNETKSVSTPNVGDIVFYNTTGSGASHAGIYIGNNKFIGSQSSTGVAIVDMNSSYWSTKYLGARTPF